MGLFHVAWHPRTLLRRDSNADSLTSTLSTGAVWTPGDNVSKAGVEVRVSSAAA